MLRPDLSYLSEVLHVGDGDTEEQLDERLRSQAKELGIDVEEQQAHEGTLFKAYYPDYPRRSESIDSRASQSTGLASTFSDLSKDRGYHDGTRRRSRASLNFRDYDAFVSRGVPDGRHSISFSPLPTPSHSTFSLPLSQPPSPDSGSPRKHFRRIRGLSMLRLHNRNALSVSSPDGCPHCPHDLASQRRAVHKLPCGHRLCTQALRNTVRHATESKIGAVPSCCGKPIPGSLVEHVMTQEEQNALLDKLEQWDEAMSIAPSVASSRRDSIHSHQQQRPGVFSKHSRTVSDESRHAHQLPRDQKELEHVIDREDYMTLQKIHIGQRDRFLVWAEKQRSDLNSKHEHFRKEMLTNHESAIEDMAEHHSSAIADAEDKQVKAESDLRDLQKKEERDNATALKHMEAYCAGLYSSGERHSRAVTEQDRAELNKARRARDQMDVRHESQINVLRGEQSRRMRLRAQRQERELQELKRLQRKTELELERTFNSEASKMDESIHEKRRRMYWRWELETAILAKKVEAETGMHLNVRLPTVDWVSRHASDSTQTQTLCVPQQDVKHGISIGYISTADARKKAQEFQIGAV
ncbi:hypothetical protein DOTSEDRAFT_75428 [Dothistroma septosporum NZE10]|uniref:Uncharacterized protein n=1 Tax=Dothistroma septosporum (strain NZE10 / CBS 128990) TaxID=675120 RepID=M2Y009_DOTSN|nr:hypothetical protein DOTSEDRAFT_75428 [Dothistroma septosporum NZE10]